MSNEMHRPHLNATMAMRTTTESLKTMQALLLDVVQLGQIRNQHPSWCH